MLDAAGVPDAADAPHTGWSDAMIDAVVPAGDEAELPARLQAYVDAGASEVAVSPFGCGPEPEQPERRAVGWSCGTDPRGEGEFFRYEITHREVIRWAPLTHTA